MPDLIAEFGSLRFFRCSIKGLAGEIGVWDLGFRVWGSRFRVWASGFRVWALGFGVLGFKV